MLCGKPGYEASGGGTIWKQRILRYWNRLCEEEIPSLLKEAVMTSNAMLLAGQDCWLARVKELFSKAGFASSFSLHGCEREVIEQVMLRYSDHYVQKWSSELQRTTNRRGSAGNKLQTVQGQLPT